MRLKSVIDYLTKVYTEEHGNLNDPTHSEEELKELESEIDSVESVCRSFRSIIQNKRAQRTFGEGTPQKVKSVKLIADDAK